MMLAPLSNRKRETAETMPGRSGQETSNRIVVVAGASGATGSVGGVVSVMRRSVADGGGRELGDEVVGIEALECERRDEVRRAIGGDQLGERLADDRSGLEAVRSPAGTDVEVLDLGAAEDRAVVR